MATRTVVDIVISNRNNYYAILGVSQTASEIEIRKAYKVRAMECHPDKSQHPRAEEAFKLVATAHETLKDKEKRRVYDHHGAEGVKAHEAGHSPAAAAAAARREQQFRNGGGGGHYYYEQHGDPFADLFSAMFGDVRRPQQRRPQQQQQGPQGANQHRQQQQQQGPDNIMAFTLMMPLLLFFFFAMMLQSNFASSTQDFGRQPRGGGLRGNGGASARVSTLFSLVRNPREGFSVERYTDLSEVSPSVPYYVQASFDQTLRRHGVSERSVDLQVAREHRDSLGRRCQAELKRRSEGGKQHAKPPATCAEYDRLRELPSA